MKVHLPVHELVFMSVVLKYVAAVVIDIAVPVQTDFTEVLGVQTTGAS